MPNENYAAHNPYRIIPSDDLDFTGFAQCGCGRVAHLRDWRVRPWRPSEEGSVSLRWEPGESWEEASDEEISAFEGQDDLLAKELRPYRSKYEL
jgi:hypothetical protein